MTPQAMHTYRSASSVVRSRTRRLRRSLFRSRRMSWKLKSTEEDESRKLSGEEGKPDAEERMASSIEEEVEANAEDLGKKIQALRQARDSSESSESNAFVQQVMEELQRVEWPGAGAAIGRTVLVIGIVGGAGALLLVLNAALAQISERLFGY